jgi:hypothetical protein
MQSNSQPYFGRQLLFKTISSESAISLQFTYILSFGKIINAAAPSGVLQKFFIISGAK